MLDKWYELKRFFRNRYFEYVNPKLGQLRESASEKRGAVKHTSWRDNLPMWFGIAAVITSVLLLLEAGLAWYTQLIIILVVVFLGPIVLKILKTLFSGADNVLAVYPGKQLVGRKITLDKPIVDGVSELTLHGERWGVRGDDMPAGTRVMVVAIKKNELFVVITETVNDDAF